MCRNLSLEDYSDDPDVVEKVQVLYEALQPLPIDTILWHATCEKKWTYKAEMWLACSVDPFKALSTKSNRF